MVLAVEKGRIEGEDRCVCTHRCVDMSDSSKLWNTIKLLHIDGRKQPLSQQSRV
jgi:hypothetical protein